MAAEFQKDKTPFVIIDQEPAPVEECLDAGYLVLLGLGRRDEVLGRRVKATGAPDGLFEQMVAASVATATPRGSTRPDRIPMAEAAIGPPGNTASN